MAPTTPLRSDRLAIDVHRAERRLGSDEATRLFRHVADIDKLRVATTELDGLCLWVMRRPNDRAARKELLHRLNSEPGPFRATGLDRRLDIALGRVAQSFESWRRLIEDDRAGLADWTGELKSGLFAVKAELERTRKTSHPAQHRSQ